MKNSPPRFHRFLRVALTLLLLPASVLAQTGGTVERSIKVGELERTYRLHVPASLPIDKPVALVLMFHGGGGTPAYAERESRFSELADREGFLVAYPKGIGKSWNDGRGSESVVAQRDHIDDVGFISALIDDVSKAYKVNSKRVFSTGMSNGAIFSQCLAVKLSTRIAAIAPVAGGLAELPGQPFKPQQPVSVCIIQGTTDPLIPYNGGNVMPVPRGRIFSTDETVKKWIVFDECKRSPVVEELADKDPSDGCRARKFTYAKGRNGTEVVLYQIEGGGHTWPNAVQYLPKWLVGQVCRDFDATQAIWQFFKTHPKP